MIEKLSIIAPGDTVYIGANGDIPAQVESVSIGRNLTVNYRLTWFSGATYYDTWVSESYIKTSTASRKQIGFQ